MKIPLLPALIASAALGLLAGCANNAAKVVATTPGCLDDVAVNRLVADYNARRPAADLPATLTMADAACTRSRPVSTYSTPSDTVTSGAAPLPRLIAALRRAWSTRICRIAVAA